MVGRARARSHDSSQPGSREIRFTVQLPLCPDIRGNRDWAGDLDQFERTTGGWTAFSRGVEDAGMLNRQRDRYQVSASLRPKTRAGSVMSCQGVMPGPRLNTKGAYAASWCCLLVPFVWGGAPAVGSVARQEREREGEKNREMERKTRLTQVNNHATLLEGLLDRCVVELLVHHPQGEFVLHVVALLLGLVVGQGIQDAAVGVGVVAAAVLKHEIGVVVVVGVVAGVGVGQLGRVGGRDPRVEGGLVRGRRGVVVGRREW